MTMAASRQASAAGLGFVYLIENALAAFVFVFFATFPFENLDPEERPGGFPDDVAQHPALLRSRRCGRKIVRFVS
jgi:hypothetical protein